MCKIRSFVNPFLNCGDSVKTYFYSSWQNQFCHLLVCILLNNVGIVWMSKSEYFLGWFWPLGLMFDKPDIGGIHQGKDLNQPKEIRTDYISWFFPFFFKYIKLSKIFFHTIVPTFISVNYFYFLIYWSPQL